MSLATRCPACGTIFRVVQDQLKVSEGWVRCGQCHEVFHGIEALFDLDSDPAVAARRAAARGPAAPPPTRVFADQRASAPIPMPTQAPAAARPAAPPSPIAIPARPSLTPPSRFGETGPPSQSPTPAARPGYTGFTPATRPLPPAPARPAPFTAPAAPLASPPAPLPPAPLSSPPPTAPGPTTFSPVATRGTIAPRFAARLAEEAARAQAATAAPTTSPVITSPVTPQTPASSPFGTALAQQPSVNAWQSTPAPHVELAPVAPEPVAPEPPPAIASVAPVAPIAPEPSPAPVMFAPPVAEPAPAPTFIAPDPEPEPEATAPALPAFAPTPLPPPPAPSTVDDLPPPPSFLMAKPAPAPAPVATPVPEAPAMYIPPSLLARPPVAAPLPPAPEPVVEPVVEPIAESVPAPTPKPERAPIPESSPPVEAPSAAATLASAFAAPIDAPVPAAASATLPEPPRTATPIIVREPTPDVGGSTLPSMLADDAADEARAGPPTLASMLPDDAGDWPPKRGKGGKKKAADPDAPESQIVDKTKDPRFLREAKSGARWRRPWVRVVLSLVAIVLVAAALGQVAWPQRDTLAARWPATLPAWQWLCDQADCKIEPPRAIASLTLEDSTLTGTDTDHVLLFSADLHNRAGHEVRMPSFDVRFMDLNGETVARKVLSPEDLGIHQDALPADGELRVHARLQMGSLAATGFQADLFYP